MSKWMALKGNSTRILGPGVVVSTDHAGARVRSLGLQPQRPPPTDLSVEDAWSPNAGSNHNHPGVSAPESTYCTAGASRCPELLSCRGDGQCVARSVGTPSAYGSFDDRESTAAFGCSLTNDGATNDGVTSADSTLAGSGGGAGPSPVCAAPTDIIGQQLSSISGWGVEWSGKYPPWAYNMNTGCPCQSDSV